MSEISDLTARLDEILSDVKRKDISLEKSMELFNEALLLGDKAAELVDIVSDEDIAEEAASLETDDGKQTPA